MVTPTTPLKNSPKIGRRPGSYRHDRHLLDEDLTFSLVEDPDDEDAEPRIEFAK